MLKQILLVSSLLMILSCNDKIYKEQIDKSNLCKYFSIEVSSKIIDGKKLQSASTKVNKFNDDNVSDFIQSHLYRFDYLITKTFISLTDTAKSFDSSNSNFAFCNAINNNTFFNHFVALTSGEKNGNKDSIKFYIQEVIKVASRFFMCDGIDKKDTSINYHICLGLNGISELPQNKDYTVLEAFCFEAIFDNLKGNPNFQKSFHRYISKSLKENKKRFTDFKTLLNNVKEECYVNMENDKELEKLILYHYKKNMDNISFRVI